MAEIPKCTCGLPLIVDVHVICLTANHLLDTPDVRVTQDIADIHDIHDIRDIQDIRDIMDISDIHNTLFVGVYV